MITTLMRRATALIAFALILNAPASAWISSKVQYDANGSLVYPADANGNRIPDYSHAGYKGGGVPLPTVPVVLTISPIAGDNTAHVQAAIDQVGNMPIQANGYRGTLVLGAGVYPVSTTLRMNKSGVVLAGVGDGTDPATNTIIRRTGTLTTDVILAGGGADDSFRSEIASSRSQITSALVQVGSRSFDVDTPALYQVGNEVVIWHPSTQAWIDSVDAGGVTDANFWKAGEIDIRYHRYITAISGNTITVDAPVFSHLNRSLSQSYLYKYDRTGVLTNIGVEDIFVEIMTNGDTSEDHANNGVTFKETENCWIRDCTINHFVAAGVYFTASTRGTAERVRAIEPHSVITGGRRYNFSTYHAQLILFNECFASYARHGFVANGTSADSGNVALKCTLANNITFSEGHRRWSSGLLFDGIVTTSRSGGDVMGFYNRGNFGTGHGWAAAHSVIWNCNALGGKVLVQQPPTAQNYAIGCFGNVTGTGPFAGPVGYIEGSNTTGLQPASLYLEQLAQRQGGTTIDNQPPTAPTNLVATGSTETTVSLSWTAATDNVGVTGYDIYNGTAVAGSTASTSFTVGNLAASTSYTFTVKARDAAGNASPASNGTSATTAASNGTPSKFAIAGSAVTASTHDGNVPANTVDGDFATRWSASGDPQWIQYDLGSSQTVSLVKIAWYLGDQRAYRFDIQVSANGTAFTNVFSGSSSATSLALETYNIDDTTARYVRIVGHGSSANAWNSITETEVWGLSSAPDTQAPSAPTNLASPSKTDTSVSLSWTGSTDNVGVTAYDIYNGTSLAGTTASASFTVSGLAASTSYTFTVKARDAAGNVSAASNAITVTTNGAAADTQAPTAPTNLSSPTKTSTSVSLAWTASTDNIGVVGYDVYQNGALVGSSSTTSFTATGLTSFTQYSFFVKARDAAGNVSAASTTIKVKTNR